MRIVFIGCVKSSAYFLKLLIANSYAPVGVVTRAHSSLNSDFENLVPICEKNFIPYLCVSDINNSDSISFIESCKPDLIYCFGWSQLLKKTVLSIPQIGSVGFHPAALPNNRGRHPLVWALALGLSKTASTFFMMEEKADTGGIISQKAIPISKDDDAAVLYHKVIHTAGKQMLSFTSRFETGSVSPVPQTVGNSWRKRNEHDGEIDWRMSGDAIYNLVRALARPYVGAHFVRAGCKIKVWKVKTEYPPGLNNIEYGKVLQVNSRTDFLIKAYDCVIHILESDPVDLTEGEYLP